jgi:hypothetical protein
VMAHAQKLDFIFRQNGRVYLNRRVAPVQSTTGSRGVRISGNNAGYTMFRGSVKGTGYPTPFASFPFTSRHVHHCLPSHFNWTLTECHYSTGYPVHSPVSPSLPLPVLHRVPSHFNWTLTECLYSNRFSSRRFLLFFPDANLFCYSVTTYKQSPPPAFSFHWCVPLMTLTNETSDLRTW